MHTYRICSILYSTFSISPALSFLLLNLSATMETILPLSNINVSWAEGPKCSLIYHQHTHTHTFTGLETHPSSPSTVFTFPSTPCDVRFPERKWGVWRLCEVDQQLEEKADFNWSVLFWSFSRCFSFSYLCAASVFTVCSCVWDLSLLMCIVDYRFDNNEICLSRQRFALCWVILETQWVSRLLFRL